MFRTRRYISLTCFRRFSPQRVSSMKFCEATHQRTMSAPYFSITESGLTPFPLLLLNASPFSFRVQPFVMTERNGAAPFVATAIISDELNHPQCWSPPSR